jgi:hypothetical protein
MDLISTWSLSRFDPRHPRHALSVPSRIFLDRRIAEVDAAARVGARVMHSAGLHLCLRRQVAAWSRNSGQVAAWSLYPIGTASRPPAESTVGHDDTVRRRALPSLQNYLAVHANLAPRARSRADEHTENLYVKSN